MDTFHNILVYTDSGAEFSAIHLPYVTLSDLPKGSTVKAGGDVREG